MKVSDNACIIPSAVLSWYNKTPPNQDNTFSQMKDIASLTVGKLTWSGTYESIIAVF